MDVNSLSDLKALQAELADQRAGMLADAERRVVATRWSRRPMLATLFRELLYERMGERPPRLQTKQPSAASAEARLDEHGQLVVLRQFDASVLTGEWVVSGDVGVLFPSDGSDVTVAKRVRDGDRTLCSAWYLAETSWGQERYTHDDAGLVAGMEVVTANPTVTDGGTRIDEWHAVYTVHRDADGAVLNVAEQAAVRPSSARG